MAIVTTAFWQSISEIYNIENKIIMSCKEKFYDLKNSDNFNPPELNLLNSFINFFVKNIK